MYVKSCLISFKFKAIFREIMNLLLLIFGKYPCSDIMRLGSLFIFII